MKRVTKSFERMDIFFKRVAKPFERLDVSTERMNKPLERMQIFFERLPNGLQVTEFRSKTESRLCTFSRERSQFIIRTRP